MYVSRYGFLVDEINENTIAEAGLKLRNEKALCNMLKKDMEFANEELCWEKESLKLQEALQGMTGGAGRNI